MKRAASLSDLEAYARMQIDAHHHPGDRHTFRMYACQDCGVVPLEPTIEHHTGSRKGDFKGRILATCSRCGRSDRFFSFTGEHRKPVHEEHPTCNCGSRRFLIGECERLEAEDGIPGFFDEGVVVGQCSVCGRHRVLVHTD